MGITYLPFSPRIYVTVSPRACFSFCFPCYLHSWCIDQLSSGCNMVVNNPQIAEGYTSIVYNLLTLHDTFKFAMASIPFLSFWDPGWKRRPYALRCSLDRGKRTKVELCDGSYSFWLCGSSNLHTLRQSKSVGLGSRQLPKGEAPGNISSSVLCFWALFTF